ncbi:MAG: hypothetical protein HYR56_28625 [Acidobacteria bacterium]|nr:hypothetical protein [Acidobacteriota bacterium]MBI3423889.1 hypothetical protein [Acidobacteriota bacterium]
MQIANHANLSIAALAALGAALPAHSTLMELVAWGKQQTPPVRLQETIALDEYTHEVVVPWRAPLWLVYSST